MGMGMEWIGEVVVEEARMPGEGEGEREEQKAEYVWQRKGEEESGFGISS